MPRISTWLRDTAGMPTMADDLINKNTATPERKFIGTIGKINKPNKPKVIAKSFEELKNLFNHGR